MAQLQSMRCCVKRKGEIEMDPIKTRREGAILEVMLDRPKANAIDLKTSVLINFNSIT